MTSKYNESSFMNEEMLMELADDMAAAATTFNAHGYEVFIRCREALKNALHSHCSELNDARSK